jgi:hypothetical protein
VLSEAYCWAARPMISGSSAERRKPAAVTVFKDASKELR